MKKILLSLSVVALFFTFSAKKVQAQDYGYYLVYLQCDPLSCEESGPFATQSTAEVNWYATCEFPDDSLADMGTSAIATVGINGPCSAPYTPVAAVETSSGFYIDDDGLEYEVDYVSNIVEIFNGAGQINLYGAATFGCDSTYGSTGSGSAPC